MENGTPFNSWTLLSKKEDKLTKYIIKFSKTFTENLFSMLNCSYFGNVSRSFCVQEFLVEWKTPS